MEVNYDFYNNYKWEKCIKSTFQKRILTWVPEELAVLNVNMMKYKNWIDKYWRTCKKCNKWKSFFYFIKWKSLCKECYNIKRREEYLERKDIINARKREKRKTPLAQQKMKLDEIFYSDENIKKIIKIEWIEKRRKKAFKWEIQKDKFFYFLNRGYDKDLLISLYGNHYLWS